MATVLAIDQDRHHIFLGNSVINLSHTSVLPRILDGICEDNILACDLKAAVSLDVIVDSGLSDGVTEDGLAVGNPVTFIDELRPHRVLLVGHLEPSELCAVLPSPLSHVVLVVHLGVGQRHSIILIKGCALLVTVLLDDRELKAHVGCCNACENVAELGSPTVLHSEGKEVSDVPHEVPVVDPLALKSVLHDFLVLVGKISENGFFNVIGNVLDGSRAFRPASRGRLEDVKVEVIEVSHRQNHTRGGPRGDSRVRVLVFEPR